MMKKINSLIRFLNNESFSIKKRHCEHTKYAWQSRKYCHLISIFLIFFVISITGCSDDKPVYSTSSGNGYNISLLIPSKYISDGGSISIQAYVTDPNGNPVPDEDAAVKFSCSQNEIKFYDDRCDIKNGFAATTASWEDDSDDDNPDPPMEATITATYRGAMNSAQIILISKAF